MPNLGQYTTRAQHDFFPEVRPTGSVFACNGDPFPVPAGSAVMVIQIHNARLLACTADPLGFVWLNASDLKTEALASD